MKKKNNIPFKVIVDNINTKQFEFYDVMPYFIRCYEDTKEADRPKNFEDFKSFIERWSKYMYWSRCQYELVLKPLVGHDNEQKVDVHWQLMHNLDLVTKILMVNVVNPKKNNL
jgi:hypothetical protein